MINKIDFVAVTVESVWYLNRCYSVRYCLSPPPAPSNGKINEKRIQTLESSDVFDWSLCFIVNVDIILIYCNFII